MADDFYLRYGSSKIKTIVYPNQFFSLADYYMPPDINELFKWCRTFFYKDPIIGPVVRKLASYPVTDFMYNVKDDVPQAKKKWKSTIEDILDLKNVLIASGLDYFVYGNSFISIYYPFTRMLQCSECDKKVDITNTDNLDSQWKLEVSGNNPHFILECPECGHRGRASFTDTPIPNVKEMNFIRWSPENIDVEYYEITGKSRYYYKMRESTIKKIKAGKDKYLLKTMPFDYIRAAVSGKTVRLDPNNLFHFKNYTLAEEDQGWGKPLIIHSLQRLFYLYTLRRAQESIAIERIVPMDIITPTQMGDASPFQHVSLPAWQRSVKKELERYRRDPNYKCIFPIPTKIDRLGGDGRMLLLGPELDQGAKDVVTGMSVPLEFLIGGMSWTGSSITLRMLENFFFSYRSAQQRLINFVTKGVRRLADLPECSIAMTDLMMADDIQRMQLTMQLYTMNLISGEDLLAEFGWDLKEQQEKIKGEMTAKSDLEKKQMSDYADAQGEAQIRSAVHSAKAQIAQQKAMNSAMVEIDNSLPAMQREAKKLNDLAQYAQLSIQYRQMLAQANGQMPPPPPEEGEEPPPEEAQQEEQSGPPAPVPAEQAAYGANPAEPPAVNEQQYGNVFYSAGGGQNTSPDIEANLKRLATDISKMPPGQRNARLGLLRQTSAAIYRKVMMYLTAIPPGGTASDANQGVMS